MHAFLIAFVIIVIVAVQVWLFFTTVKKIALFKAVIPSAEHFGTVKVYIPEDQIKDIGVDYILNHLDRFRNPGFASEEIETDDAFSDEPDFREPFPEPQNTLLFDDDTADEQAFVWISKLNVEKKIPNKELQFHELSGWKKI